jgi:pilus assembly protein CpaC
VARQKIADFITRDVNNPEVKITAVGNFIKLEGQVNDDAEKTRIKNIVNLYLPDIVTDVAQGPSPETVKISGRKQGLAGDDFIIDLITVRPREEKVEPPPKMIQIVTHFVRFTDGYTKAFNFSFSPAISTQAGVNGEQNPGTTSSSFDSTINLLNNLLPRLQWARSHGFAKILDTASVLIQDKQPGVITRQNVAILQQVSPSGVTGAQQVPTAKLSLSVTPTIKSERSGLVELSKLLVTVSTGGGKAEQSDTTVNTTISVRDRQSAAFGGIIKKSTETVYGAPTNDKAIITFNAKKEYARDNSQFVVFVTPIIKASASTGVEQVKKKFRLKD